MGKSYANEIVEREVSIAIEQLLAAPVGTTFPTTRVDVASPPNGFTHLGAVVEDSIQVNITREKYQLATGIPRVLQYDAVLGMAGQLTISFYSLSNRLLRYTLGGEPPVYEFTSANVTQVGSTPAPTRTQVPVASTANFTVGDVVITAASTTGLASSQNEAEVSSVGSAMLYLKGDGLDSAPGAGHVIVKVDRSRVAFGTAKIQKFALLGVADFVDGAQVQHHLFKATPVGEFTETPQPGQASIITGTFDLFGVKGNSVGAHSNWTNELILGERIYIPKTS